MLVFPLPLAQLPCELRKSPEFAAEYLRAALEDADEPRVLLIALRRIAKSARRHCQGRAGPPLRLCFLQRWGAGDSCGAGFLLIFVGSH